MAPRHHLSAYVQQVPTSKIKSKCTKFCLDISFCPVYSTWPWIYWGGMGKHMYIYKYKLYRTDGGFPVTTNLWLSQVHLMATWPVSNRVELTREPGYARQYLMKKTQRLKSQVAFQSSWEGAIKRLECTILSMYLHAKRWSIEALKIWVVEC